MIIEGHVEVKAIGAVGKPQSKVWTICRFYDEIPRRIRNSLHHWSWISVYVDL